MSANVYGSLQAAQYPIQNRTDQPHITLPKYFFYGRVETTVKCVAAAGIVATVVMLLTCKLWTDPDATYAGRMGFKQVFASLDEESDMSDALYVVVTDCSNGATKATRYVYGYQPGTLSSISMIRKESTEATGTASTSSSSSTSGTNSEKPSS
ncbi:hypothetical protein BKA67DRAFT_530215 [Truncatella angustata]|uniref:Uncharacterized protein n=1 Tax=Truncatella angustata TaxID=152316 RepID=A0A9P8UVN8_9PEZI|nr:uncharacterized protein BKA67DRAFT_530215 [Truncatella angustata]KAH6660099.1 hypothetical protein BKA67DRAFT_530215 [Truncatella angustata]